MQLLNSGFDKSKKKHRTQKAQDTIVYDFENGETNIFDKFCETVLSILKMAEQPPQQEATPGENPPQQYAQQPGQPVYAQPMPGQQPMPGYAPQPGQQYAQPMQGYPQQMPPQQPMQPQSYALQMTKQMNPISNDAPVDQGPIPEYDIEYIPSAGRRPRMIHKLKFPESNQNQIVARVPGANAAAAPCSTSPAGAIPIGSDVQYTLDWKADCWVAQVVSQDEINTFMNGLKAKLDPALRAHMQASVQAFMCICIICCCTCMLCLPCAILYLANSVAKRAGAMHQLVVKYCHENRGPFYARGVRPRPGTCGSYIIFEAS